MSVETLPQFYELMYTTIPARRALTEEVLGSRTASAAAAGRGLPYRSGLLLIYGHNGLESRRVGG